MKFIKGCHFQFMGNIPFIKVVIWDNWKWSWKETFWQGTLDLLVLFFSQVIYSQFMTISNISGNTRFGQIWSNLIKIVVLIKFDQIQYFLLLVNQSTKKNKTTQSRNISNDYICRILLLKLLWKLFTTSVTLDKRVILLTKENLVVGHASQGDESHEVQGFCNEEYES